MANKDKFLEGAKVTKDNQIYGTPNSKSKNGTGDSPNDNGGKSQSERKSIKAAKILGCFSNDLGVLLFLLTCSTL